MHRCDTRVLDSRGSRRTDVARGTRSRRMCSLTDGWRNEGLNLNGMSDQRERCSHRGAEGSKENHDDSE